MLNIPTELLRTLLTVVDLRSFTRAARMLGITQPAVSSQIKRLQSLLGYELIDKTAPGVSLTSRGEMVLGHARRMLAINDQIAQLGGGRPPAATLRVGMPGEFAAVELAAAVAQVRKRWPDIRFRTTVGNVETLLHGLRQGDLDICLVMSDVKPVVDAHHIWMEQPVWVRSELTELAPSGPVALVSLADDDACRRLAVNVLNRAGRECDFVFTSRSIASLEAAVLAGLGVTVLPKSHVSQTSLSTWDDAPLPALPQLHCGVFVREVGGKEAALDELAAAIAGALRPRRELAAGAPSSLN